MFVASNKLPEVRVVKDLATHKGIFIMLKFQECTLFIAPAGTNVRLATPCCSSLGIRSSDGAPFCSKCGRDFPSIKPYGVVNLTGTSAPLAAAEAIAELWPEAYGHNLVDSYLRGIEILEWVRAFGLVLQDFHKDIAQELGLMGQYSREVEHIRLLERNMIPLLREATTKV